MFSCNDQCVDDSAQCVRYLDADVGVLGSNETPYREPEKIGNCIRSDHIVRIKTNTPQMHNVLQLDWAMYKQS